MFARFSRQLRECNEQLKLHKAAIDIHEETLATKDELLENRIGLTTLMNEKIEETNKIVQTEAIDRLAQLDKELRASIDQQMAALRKELTELVYKTASEIDTKLIQVDGKAQNALKEHRQISDNQHNSLKTVQATMQERLDTLEKQLNIDSAAITAL